MLARRSKSTDGLRCDFSAITFLTCFPIGGFLKISRKVVDIASFVQSKLRSLARTKMEELIFPGRKNKFALIHSCLILLCFSLWFRGRDRSGARDGRGFVVRRGIFRPKNPEAKRSSNPTGPCAPSESG